MLKSALFITVNSSTYLDLYHMVEGFIKTIQLYRVCVCVCARAHLLV